MSGAAASSGSRSTAHPTWFGPQSAPLFGVVHIPADGRARAAVVLCPPIGVELTATAHGLRLLAQDLADQGLAVLRFDYRGTGHSADGPTPATVSEWCEDIGCAVQYLRASGIDTVGLVGLRVGALLATQLCGQLDIRALVLWDPVLSGRRFIRENQAMLAMLEGGSSTSNHREPAKEEVPLLGWSLAAGAAAELRARRLTANELPHIPTLLAYRSDADTSFIEAANQRGATTIPAPDSIHFVAPSEFLPVQPLRTGRAIVHWLDAAFSRERYSDVEIKPELCTQAAMESPHGTVIETLQRLGPHALFAVESRPPASASEITSEVVLHSTSLDPAHGPGQLWPRLAREAAAKGARVLRYDRRGVGETSPVLAGHTAPLYSTESIDDVHFIADTLTGPVEKRLHIGLCSGGWMGSVAALKQAGSRICMISPQYWHLKPKPLGLNELAAAGWNLETGQAPLPTDSEAARQRKDSIKTLLRMRMPYRLWRELSRRHLVQCPEGQLRALLSGGSRVTLIFPASDWQLFTLNRGVEALRRLGPLVTRLTLRQLADNGKNARDDHTLYTPEYRRETMQVLSDLIESVVMAPSTHHATPVVSSSL